MKKLKYLICCFIVFSLPGFAASTIDNKPILTCPRTVECDLDPSKGASNQCHLSDNPYKMWGKPYSGGMHLNKGSYKLKKVLFDRGQYWPVCQYFLNEKQPSPISVSILNGGTAGDGSTAVLDGYSNQFKAISTDFSKWSGSSTNDVCLSNNPSECPLVEIPEVAIARIGQSPTLRFYFIENDGWETKCITFSVLQYKDLYNRCGATSSCTLNIGTCYDYMPEHPFSYGTVTLDISNPDSIKIDSIDTDSSIVNLYTLKKLEPFNTIYLENKILTF